MATSRKRGMMKKLKYFGIFIMWVVAFITFIWGIYGLPTYKFSLVCFAVYVLLDIEKMKPDDIEECENE